MMKWKPWSEKVLLKVPGQTSIQPTSMLPRFSPPSMTLMKLIPLTVLFFAACKKEKQPKKTSTLLGKWNFRAGYRVHSYANRSDTISAVYADKNNILISILLH